MMCRSTGYLLVSHCTCPKSYTGTRNPGSKVASGRTIPVEVVVLLPLCRTSCPLALKPRPISLGGRGAMRRGTHLRYT